jgi:hypothetical protein
MTFLTIHELAIISLHVNFRLANNEFPIQPRTNVCQSDYMDKLPKKIKPISFCNQLSYNDSGKYI